jgi:hypothetical protein
MLKSEGQLDRSVQDNVSSIKAKAAAKFSVRSGSGYKSGSSAGAVESRPSTAARISGDKSGAADDDKDDNNEKVLLNQSLSTSFFKNITTSQDKPNDTSSTSSSERGAEVSSEASRPSSSSGLGSDREKKQRETAAAVVQMRERLRRMGVISGTGEKSGGGSGSGKSGSSVSTGSSGSDSGSVGSGSGSGSSSGSESTADRPARDAKKRLESPTYSLSEVKAAPGVLMQIERGRSGSTPVKSPDEQSDCADSMAADRGYETSSTASGDEAEAMDRFDLDVEVNITNHRQP